MSNDTLISRFPVLTAVCAFVVAAGPVWGQSNSTLITDPGSTIDLTVGFSAVTDSGSIGGVDSDSTSVEGTARVTVLPTDPPFTHCRVHALSMALGEIHLGYIVNMITVTFTDLVIESTEQFDGTIDGAGNVTFTSTRLRVTGTVHLYSLVFEIDETIPVDATSDAPISARLSESAGTITLDEIVIPRVDWVVPPELLPDGFLSLEVTVDSDASGVVFRGPYEPGILGDGNADGLVNPADYPYFFDCFTGPTGTADIYCSTFLFDEDGDVDLFDLAKFLNTVEAP